MNRHISVLICVFTLATTAKVAAIDPNRRGHEHEYEQEQEQEQEQEHEKKQKYTCPMHPEVVTNHPGNCPKCGMKLVPLKQNKRRTSNAQRPTSNSEHMMHDEHEMAMPHHDHGGHEMHPPSHEGREMRMEMHSSIN